MGQISIFADVIIHWLKNSRFGGQQIKIINLEELGRLIHQNLALTGE